jgi:dienelactone hydrolase
LNTEAKQLSGLVIPVQNAQLLGDLALPEQALGLVIFAHGSGSSRKSSRNQAVSSRLRKMGLATLLFDLLTVQEENQERDTGHLRFDIPMLAARLADVSMYMRSFEMTSNLQQAYFGASTGAAAALVASIVPGIEVKAIVSRGGRPDLAAAALQKVRAPTLLLVGSQDPAVLELNRDAYAQIPAEKELAIIAGATHLFEEPGTLEEVAELAGEWIRKSLEPH